MKRPMVGFVDANSRYVTLGDKVEYEAKPGKLYTVTDITQDGDAQIVKWRSICKYLG